MYRVWPVHLAVSTVVVSPALRVLINAHRWDISHPKEFRRLREFARLTQCKTKCSYRDTSMQKHKTR